MKTGDEWLAIGGGIGTIVLFIALFQRTKKSASPTPGSAQTGYYPTNSGAPMSGPDLLTPTQSAQLATPAENITIGGTRFGNMVIGAPSLFPLFGYAANTQTDTNQAYQLANNLIGSNSVFNANQSSANDYFANAESNAVSGGGLS